MGLSDQEVVYRIVVDSTGAVKGIQQVGESFKEVTRSADNSTSGFSRLQAGLVAIDSALNIASRAFNTVKAAIDKVSDVLDLGDKFNDVSESFDQLTEKAGLVSETLLSQLNTATKGTIDNLDLMTAANKALIAGLDPEILDEVAGAAHRYAEATGIDAVDAMDRFAKAIAGGKEKQLEMLGLLRDGKIVIEGYATATEGLTGLQGGASDAFAQAAKSIRDLTNETAGLIEKSPEVRAAITVIGGQLLELAQVILPKLVKLTNDFSRGLLVLSKISLKDVTLQGQFLENAIKEAATEYHTALQKVQEGMGKTKDVQTEFNKGLDEGAKAVKKIAEELEKLDFIDQLPPIIERVNRIGEELFRQLEAGTITTDQFNESIKTISRSLVSEFGFSAEQATEAVSGLFDEFSQNEKLLKDVEKAGEESGEAFSEGFSAAATFGIDLLNDIIQGNDLSAAGIGSQVGGLIGGDIGASIGNLVGGIVDDFLNHEPSQGTKARNAVNEFFESLFIDLKIPSADEFVAGTFDDAFEALPDIAQTSVAGVGLAFDQLIGITTEKFGLVGAALANTVGADLNDLQLLVQKTGYSFEQLEKVVVDSFLQGKVSFLEAQSALIGIQRISEKGIPGAIGAVTEAFNNFIEAGTKGGLASVDALKDIGAEALELGLTTLPQVQAQLEASGAFTSESIKQTFDALATFGINSIEDLSNLSNETAIAIGSQLQAQNFPFEETAAKIDDLLSKLEDVPAEIESNIRLNVSTKFDSDTKKLVDSGADLSAVNLSRGEGIASA